METKVAMEERGEEGWRCRWRALMRVATVEARVVLPGSYNINIVMRWTIEEEDGFVRSM